MNMGLFSGCKSHHSAGGICITLWAVAGPEISPSGCLPTTIPLQIPPAEIWDLQLEGHNLPGLLKSPGRMKKRSPSCRMKVINNDIQAGGTQDGLYNTGCQEQRRPRAASERDAIGLSVYF